MSKSCVCFRNDKTLLSCYDNQIKIWNNEQQTLQFAKEITTTSTVSAIQTSNNYVIIGCYKKLYIYNILRQRLVEEKTDTDNITCISISSDECYFATVSGKKVTLWIIAGSPFKVIKHDRNVSNVVFYNSEMFYTNCSKKIYAYDKFGKKLSSVKTTKPLSHISCDKSNYGIIWGVYEEFFDNVIEKYNLLSSDKETFLIGPNNENNKITNIISQDNVVIFTTLDRLEIWTFDNTHSHLRPQQKIIEPFSILFGYYPCFCSIAYNKFYNKVAILTQNSVKFIIPIRTLPSVVLPQPTFVPQESASIFERLQRQNQREEQLQEQHYSTMSTMSSLRQEAEEQVYIQIQSRVETISRLIRSPAVDSIPTLFQEQEQLDSTQVDSTQVDSRPRSQTCFINTIDQTSQCGICHELLFQAQLPVSVLTCNHLFHKPCIQEWCNNKRECPFCKKSIPENF